MIFKSWGQGPMCQKYFQRVALIPSENNATNKVKTADMYQFDAIPTGMQLYYQSLIAFQKVTSSVYK